MKVVIVGGGFGGVRAALKLANKPDIEVKLISNQSYFEYHAALYRSATGRSPLEVAIPLNDFFAYAKNVEVINDEVNGIDAQQKIIRSESGSRYSYDAAIFALGNVTEFYGIRGLKKHSFGVKTIHEALELKRHLHEQLLNSPTEKHYVVVGAGATGVELSAELMAYLKKIRRRHKVKQAFSVHLIEAAPKVLSAMPVDFSKRVQRRLRRLGVKLQTSTAITGESVDSLLLPNRSINTQTVIWTAGVKNHPFFAKHRSVFELAKANRVEVDEYLQAAPNVFVIGDSAATQYAGMAQTALHDANFVTDNLLRQTKGKAMLSYRPVRPIYAIPVGPRWAAILWGKVKIEGRLGWLIRRFADLKLYLLFLPPRKALITWRYGFVDKETCSICQD